MPRITIIGQKKMSYNFYIPPTAYEAAKQNGISTRLLTDRVRVLGWSIERATRDPPRKQGDWGKWVDVAKANNISSGTFYRRVNESGMQPEQAATMLKMDKQTRIGNIAIAKRKYPKELEDIAAANGIGKKTFVSRMFRKWNPLEAATTPVRR